MTSIKQGDMFKMGKHRVICGDCTKQHIKRKLLTIFDSWGEVDTATLLTVDMVITNPPFPGRDDHPRKYETVWRKFLNAYDPNVLYVMYAANYGYVFEKLCRDLSYEFKQQLIWVDIKDNASDRFTYRWAHVPILYMVKDGSHDYEIKIKYKPTTVITSSLLEHEDDMAIKYNQPSAKPYLLYQHMLSKHGVITVCDPFCGTGGLLEAVLATKNDDYVCLLCDGDPNMVQAVLDRYKNITGNEAVKCAD